MTGSLSISFERGAIVGQPTAVQRTRSIADGVGLIGSAICAAHCLAVPVLLIIGATIPAALLDESLFHIVMLAILVPGGALAFSLGCRRHRDQRVLTLGVLGIVGITCAALAPHEILGESGERILTLLATVALLSAHWRNFRLCRDAGDEGAS